MQPQGWQLFVSVGNLFIRGFRGPGFHLSTNHFEVLREIYGVIVFVFLFLRIGPPYQHLSNSILGIPCSLEWPACLYVAVSLHVRFRNSYALIVLFDRIVVLFIILGQLWKMISEPQDGGEEHPQPPERGGPRGGAGENIKHQNQQ